MTKSVDYAIVVADSPESARRFFDVPDNTPVRRHRFLADGRVEYAVLVSCEVATRYAVEEIAREAACGRSE